MAPLLFLAHRGVSSPSPFSLSFGIPVPDLFWANFAGHPPDPYSLTLVSRGAVSFMASGIPVRGVESAVGPALAVFQDKLILVWSQLESVPEPGLAVPEPGLVLWSSFDPASQLWTVPAQIPPPPDVLDRALRTARSPALAVFEDRLFVACRGYGSDSNIHWTSFDGTAWDTTGLYGFSGVNTDVGTANAPAIAAYQGPLDPKPLLYMAWRGVDDDERLWWATFDGANWTSQREYAGNGTSNGPAMAVYRNVLYLVWNGAHGDPRIWFTSLVGVEDADGRHEDWRPRQEVAPGGGVATNESPAVTVFQDKLYMAHGGLGNSNIYWTFFDGQDWATFPDGQRQQLTDVNIGTASGPALVAFDPMTIPFSQQTRLSRLTHELQQAALESGQLIGQALTLSEKTRQLSQTAIETAESLLLKDQEDEEHEDEQPG